VVVHHQEQEGLESDIARQSHFASVELLAGRVRVRRLVAGIVVGLGSLVIVVWARSLAAGATRQAPVNTSFSIPQTALPSIDPDLPLLAEVPSSPAPSPPVEVAAASSAAPENLAAIPEEGAEAAAAPSVTEPAAPSATVAAAPSAPPAGSASPVSAVADPKREAQKLMNRGRMRDGIPFARAAIDRDPGDAESYLLLGAALQDTGQWKEAVATFSRCVHEASRGPTGECRALGGR
jgi:hypothetical protein